MKTEISTINMIWSGMAFMLLIACQQDKTYEISNPGNRDAIDLATVVSRSALSTYLSDSLADDFLVVKDMNGELLPSQCDDMDGDGSWDELAFLCDLEAGETKKVMFERVAVMPDFPVRTNIRFGRMVKPFEEVTGDLRMKTNDTKFTAPVYQMEGPAWENDLVAFRNYYDARNGIDIFGKRTSAMVMDSTGVNGRDYHTLAEWGMDVLKVGNSLGAGAIAIGTGDSIYRVGPCEEGRYRQITEGPVRAILELTYNNVPAGERMYNVIHQVSIYAGDRFYRSRVWIPGLQDDEVLVTGIVDMHAIPADTLSEGNWKIMATLGNQGFNDEVLGMGIIVPEKQFTRYWEAPATGGGIVNTHLVGLEPGNSAAAEYCFLAVWELQDQKIKNREYFLEILREAARRIDHVSED
jgi:hypothetical protein